MSSGNGDGRGYGNGYGNGDDLSLPFAVRVTRRGIKIGCEEHAAADWIDGDHSVLAAQERLTVQQIAALREYVEQLQEATDNQQQEISMRGQTESRYPALVNTARGVHFGWLEHDGPEAYKPGDTHATIYGHRHVYWWACDRPEGLRGLCVQGPNAKSKIGPAVHRTRINGVCLVEDVDASTLDAWAAAKW